MENYVEITLPAQKAEEKEMLVALLTDAGFEGFEEKESELLAFIPQPQFDSEEIQTTLSALPIQFSIRVIPPLNWNTEWEKNFEPVRVDDFCYVRAAFHAALPGIKYDLLINPKMSFGTGHHATTWMMIHAMKNLDLRGKRVLDFGTGTGILAILAEKCGASAVLAFDNDDQCILNASENIVDNECVAIKLERRDRLENCPVFDVILANINRNTILAHLPSMRQHLSTGGVLVLSGLLEEDQNLIISEARQCDLLQGSAESKDQWVCIQFKRA